MAIPLDISDVYKATFYCYLPAVAQVSNNSIHYIITGITSGGPTDQTLATYLDGLAAPLYKLIMCDNAIYYGVKIYRVQPTATGIPAQSIANTGNGTGGTLALPSAVCGLIKFGTTYFGKKGRGRIYLPFPYQAAADANGIPTAAYKVLLNNLAESLAGNPFNVVIGPINFQMESTLYAKGPPVRAYALTSAVAEGSFATQHRRGQYGKTNTIPPF